MNDIPVLAVGLRLGLTGGVITRDPDTGHLMIEDNGQGLGLAVTLVTPEGTLGPVYAAFAPAAPRLSGVTLSDQAYVQGTGAQVFDTAVGFTGTGLSYSLSPAVSGVSIAAATGVVTTSTTAVLAQTSVTVRASNAGGFVERSFRIGVAVAAPSLSGVALADQAYVQGSGAQTYATAVAFSGTGLTYALSPAVTGVSIAAATGVVTTSTTAVLAQTSVTVRASNASGFVERSFRIGVAVAAPRLSGVALADQAYVQGTGAQTYATAVAFSGTGLSYALSPAVTGVSIAAATGVVTTSTTAVLAQTSVTVRASNASGFVERSFRIGVAVAAPSLSGVALADQAYVQGTGAQTYATAVAFSGTGLSYALSPAVTGVSIAAATGVVTTSTTAVLAQTSVTVRASNASGFVERSFRIGVAVAAPSLSGVALADQAYVQGTGAQTYATAVAFSGTGLSYALSPAVTGVSIAAATGVVTTSTTAVLAQTSVTVRASNASGFVERSFRIGVAVAAPSLSGVTLSDQLNLVRGSTASTVSAAAAVTGTITAWSITGAGVSIHATTGLITFAKTTIQPVQTVTVRASNASGFAETSFQMSVVLGALDLANVTLTIRPDPTGETITGVPAGFATWTVDLANPPADLTALWWRGDAHVEGQGPGTGYHPMIRHPSVANRWIARAVTPVTGAPRLRSFLYVDDPAEGSTTNLLGQTKTHHFIWSTDSASLNPLTEMQFSGPTAALVQTLRLFEASIDPVSRILPLVNASEYAQLGEGYVSGDGMQQIVAVGQCESRPDVIVLGQDSGSLWRTVDFGASWRRPTKRGLFAQNTWGVAVDPVDPNRTLVYGGGLYDATLAGLYLSTDGCESFAPRKVDGSTLTGEIGEFNGIAHAPGSIGATRAEKWFCVLSCRDEVNAVCARSVDGGETWTSVGNIWGTTRGNVSSLVGDPSNESTFWASSTTGLYKITNVFSGTLTVTQVPVVSGNASAAVTNRAVISANGQTIKVAVPSQGIYLSTNGGTSFTRQGSFTNFQKGFISPWNTNFIVTTKEISASASRPYATTNGTSFTQPADSAIEKRPGVTATVRMCHTRNHVLFHSGRSGSALLIGRQSELFTGNNHYRTTDGGATWSLANTGYNGSNFKIMGQCPAMFSINDKNKMALPLYDISARFSLDGFRTTLAAGDAKSAAIAAGMPAATAAVPAIGAAVHPGAGSQVVLQVLGPYDNICFLIRSDDHGATWDPVYTNLAGVKAGGIFYNYADPGKVMWYNRRSIDGNWAVWGGIMTGLDSTDAVCAHTTKLSGTNAFFSSSIASGDGRVIKRSTDNGASWSTVLSLSYSIMGPLRFASMAVHPSNADIVYVRDSTRYRIRKYDLSVSSTTPAAILNLFGASATTQNTTLYPRPMEIGHIAIDPRYPDVMYVTCKGAGQSNLWRSTNAGATWEALDAHAGLIAKNGIAVHPLTGDLIVGGDNGSHIIPPPYAQAGTLFSQLTYDNYVGLA